MPLRKKKISELPLADSLKGLYTIGYKIIDGIKTSVKVSLEDIQTAYQDVVNAIKKSEEAAKNANNAATTANEKAVLADTAAANANDTAEHPTYIGQDLQMEQDRPSIRQDRHLHQRRCFLYQEGICFSC